MSEDAMIGQHGYSTEAHHLQIRSSDETKLLVIAGEAIRRDRLFDHGQDIP